MIFSHKPIKLSFTVDNVDHLLFIIAVNSLDLVVKCGQTLGTAFQEYAIDVGKYFVCRLGCINLGMQSPRCIIGGKWFRLFVVCFQTFFQRLNVVIAATNQRFTGNLAK